MQGTAVWEERLEVAENMNIEALNRVVAHPPLFKEIIRANPDAVLEAGCGAGAMSYFLARYLDAEVVGIDQEEGVIKQLQRKNSKQNLRYQVANGFELETDFSRNESGDGGRCGHHPPSTNSRESFC